MPRKLNVVAKANEAELAIYAPIGDSAWGDTISANDVHTALKGLPANTDHITVRINSAGGDVFQGLTIYNRLKQHKAKVTVYVDGMAASIASIIMLAGDEIIMSEGSQIMIHKPWTYTAGNSLQLEETIRRLNEIEDQMVGIYSRATGKERSEIRTMLMGDYWMDANEALELGFVTRTMEPSEQLDIAASLDDCKRMYKNIPEGLFESVSAKVVQADITSFLGAIGRPC